ncbi:Uncharacterized protein Adt_40131 [Abeliophyllum distichum]|uniref:Uncharacterized protein n=1 Tax=Abeliophyllum distichum TaxID=126358 RepID=A0ABD1Q736_9LAMI
MRTARSTMEFEFIVLDEVGEKAKWLRTFLEDILCWPKPVPAHRHNTIKQLISDDAISDDYIKSKENLADPLTKGLPRDQWKNNAKIAKENRVAQGQDGEMKKHTASSVSFVTTKKRLENDMDHHMSQLELFSHVHKTNHGLGDFIDKKSKRVHDKYKASIEFTYGTDRDAQPEFDPDSWFNAVNGPSKGRIYGFGPRQPVSHVLSTPTSPRRSILAHDIMNNEDVNKLKSELASARNMIEENNERIDNLTVRLERVERNHKVELRDTMRNMLSELNIPNNQFHSSSGSRNNDI